MTRDRATPQVRVPIRKVRRPPVAVSGIAGTAVESTLDLGYQPPDLASPHPNAVAIAARERPKKPAPPLRRAGRLSGPDALPADHPARAVNVPPVDRLIALIPAGMQYWRIVNPVTKQHRLVVSIDDAAVLAGVHWRSIYRWMRTGRVDVVRVAGGLRRVFVDSIYHPAK